MRNGTGMEQGIGIAFVLHCTSRASGSMSSNYFEKDLLSMNPRLTGKLQL